MVSAAITDAGSVTSSMAKTANVKTQDSTIDFSIVFSKSISNAAGKNNSQMQAGQNLNKDISYDSTSVSNKTDVSEQTDSVKDAKAESRKDTDKVSQTGTESVKDDENVSEKLEEAGSKVLDKIKENFGLSGEELAEAMEMLGLTLTDLLVPNNITKLIVEATGNQDAMSIVTDSDLSAALMDTMSFLDEQLAEVSGELDIPMEDLKGLINDVALSSNLEEHVASKEGDVQSQDYIDGDGRPVVSQKDSSEHETMQDVVARKLTVNKEAGASDDSLKNSNDNLKHSEESSKTDNEPHASFEHVTGQISSAFETAFEAVDSHISPVDVVNQVVNSIKLNNFSELKSIEIQLNPQNLGKVNLMVSVREGVVTAQISTENEQVKRALESQLSTLRENIEQQGIKVEAVEITVQTNAFEANQQFGDKEPKQDSKGSRKVRLGGFDISSDDEMPEEENVNYNENSSVEYMA